MQSATLEEVVKHLVPPVWEGPQLSISCDCSSYYEPFEESKHRTMATSTVLSRSFVQTVVGFPSLTYKEPKMG